MASADPAEPRPSILQLSSGLRPYPPDLDGVYREQLVHGPRLHAITGIEGISSQGISLSLRTAPPPADWIQGGPDRWSTDPLVIDGVFQALILWCRAERGAPSLPSRIARYHQFSPVPRGQVRAVAVVTAVQGNNVTADVELSDEAGRQIARLEGYVCTTAASLEQRFQEGRTPRSGQKDAA